MTNITDIIQFAHLDQADLVAGELFQRKFGDPLPDVPHHVVALYQKAPQQLITLSYLHLRPFGDIALIGGACTDGQAFAHMPEAHRALFTPDNSPYLHLLRYAFRTFTDHFDAFFGYCNDPRAEAVDLCAGFEKTEHPHLLAHWHKPLHPVFQRALLAKAHAIGPF